MPAVQITEVEVGRPIGAPTGFEPIEIVDHEEGDVRSEA